ncbi:uncharacterized protein LOC131683036 [Topomyia yanbarensis]|uniref:uncharacterized protein LOC131683036 n=1 Tax=Topomyia yanbarensis TaxID=2498891 RepID=UPI00273ABAFF|nr:uncharacterized protein LOC131683036 [Topomyia yanbarensis]
MSQIECLPVEVMCCIFDKLTSLERKSLHLVCRDWYRILTRKHYLLRRQLKVYPENVELFEAGSEAWIKFPCVSIRDDDSSPKSVRRRNFLSALRRAVLCQPVLTHIEELVFEFVQSDLLRELFGETCDGQRFPNLNYLVVRCSEFSCMPEIRTWHFPKCLTRLGLVVSCREEVRLIEAVGAQLEELLIETVKLELLLECCNLPVFEKLRTLKLISDTFFPDRFSGSSDIGENFARTLNRLKNLAIGFRHNDFRLGYAPLLQNCQKLETLSILGMDLDVGACNAIGRLGGLRKLELLLRIEKDSELISWNFQNLISMHTYVWNLAPLGENLPSLEVIRISNYTIREGRFSVQPAEKIYLQRYFSHFQTIVKLFLYDIYLEEDLLLQFPTMKVREVVLRCVRTSSLILDIIYERAPKVFYVYFWDCCFLVSPRAKIPSFEELRRLLPHVRISHSSSKIITVDYGQILS